MGRAISAGVPLGSRQSRGFDPCNLVINTENVGFNLLYGPHSSAHIVLKAAVCVSTSAAVVSGHIKAIL